MSHSPYGVACAERALGRAAQVEGHLPQAETRLTAALGIFASIEARYDLARMHVDLAALAHARNDPDAVTRHLDEAQGLFNASCVPRHLERTRELAKELKASPAG